jgi:hypothetical protein
VSALSSSIAAGIAGGIGGAPASVNGSLARPSTAGQAPGLKAFRPGR